MTTHLCTVKRAVSALAAPTSVAACSTGTQSSLGPSENAQNGSRRVWPLATVSNVARINNPWSQTILGSGSATCWTISPTPLPAVAPKHLESASHAHVQYALPCYCAFCPSVTDQQYPVRHCTFNVASDGTNFMYFVAQGKQTDCTARPSPISSIDEILTCDQITPVLLHRIQMHNSNG